LLKRCEEPPPSAKAEYSSCSRGKKLNRRRNLCYTEIFEYIIKYGALKFPLLTLLGGVIRPGFPGRPDGGG